MSYKDKKVAILGFGIEGKDLAKYLIGEGADITVFDKKNAEELDLTHFNEKDLNFILGEKYLDKGLKEYDVVFRSPGIYRYLPKIVDAERSGVEITSAIKLFLDKTEAKVIGVTGTKGKGTTSTLIFRILKESGKDVYLAGNIGQTPISLIDKLDHKSIVVLELSSFQTMDLEQSPHIAVILNITSDHLDWHKDINEYIEAKRQLINHQSRDDFAVLSHDYAVSKDFAEHTKAQVFYFSKRERVHGSYVIDNMIFLNINKKTEYIGEVDRLLLRGEHNWENITAAVCASALSGADIDAIKKATFRFKGLEHRLELVGKCAGVEYYNDSFATNPQPTIAAIRSFNEPVTLILGGYDKGLDYKDLVSKIAENQVNNLVLIGDLANKLEGLIKSSKYNGGLFNLGKTTMKEVVEKAAEVTESGGVVLLSPAAASFDMFDSYKDRGNKFKMEVKNLC